MIVLRLLEIYFWVLQLQIHTEIQAIIQFTLILKTTIWFIGGETEASLYSERSVQWKRMWAWGPGDRIKS